MTSSEPPTGVTATALRWARHPVVLTIAAGLLLVVVLLAGLWIAQRGQALPNTEVAGVAVGGMTGPQISDAIDPVARAREADEVTFAFEDETFPVVPADVGYRIDDEASVEAALSRGRRNLFVDPIVRVTSLWRTHDVGLAEVLDEQQVEAEVDDIAERVDRPTSTGEVTADPETLEVRAVLPQGRAEVRREETVEALTEALRRPGAEELELPVDVGEPPFDPTETEAAAAQLETLLDAPFALTADDEELTVEPSELAELIAVEVTEDEDGLEFVVTEEAVEEVLGDRARDRFDASPVSVRYGTSRTPPTSFSDMGSTTWRPVTASSTIEPGRDGRDFDPEDAAEKLTAAVRDGDRSVETELIVTQPPVPNARADELQPTHLLGTFTTSYTAGQTRVANIQRLADVIDDTQIAPGEQFSINDISGDRSCDKGYEPAGTIVRGELVDTCGGGVSQFGTTTFNAAFFSGVQLDDWRAHSFYISRYPEGREATLSFPQLDVRFTNDTDGVVVVRASYTSTTVTVSLYGRPVAESVSASHGSRTDVREPATEERTTSDLPQGQTRTIQETGADGFRVQVVRTVRYLDGSEDSTTITTRYQPQDGILERGTGPPATSSPPEPEEPDED